MNAPPDLRQAGRDPERLLDATLRDWGGHEDAWIFGYASLIWRPEFESAEDRSARSTAGIAPWRCARASIAARPNAPAWSSRWWPEAPAAAAAPTGSSTHASRASCAASGAARCRPASYDPKWLPCRTPQGVVRALTFTLSRRSPSHTGALPDEKMVEILRTANGRYAARFPISSRPRRRCATAEFAIATSSVSSISHAATPSPPDAPRPRLAGASRDGTPRRADSRSSQCLYRSGCPDRRARSRPPDSEPPGGARLRRRSGDELRIELGRKSHRMATQAAVLGIDDRVMVELAPPPPARWMAADAACRPAGSTSRWRAAAR